MSKMRESGIEWIGEIPTHWSLCKLGTQFYMKGRIGWQGLNSADFIEEGPYLITGTDFDGGGVSWESCYHISENRFAEDPSIHVKDGDVLFTKDGTVGKVAYIENAPEKVSLNSHLLLIRPLNESVSNRFLFWMLQSDVFGRFKYEVQHGTVMDSVSQTNMAHFVFPVPELHEQRVIAECIDYETSRIDHAVSLIEQQIETLERYRRSLIQEVVTKGLDPDVPMKDSGVEWIGEIPAHWKSFRFANVIKGTQNGLTRRDFGSGEGQIVLRIRNIKDSVIDYESADRVQMTSEEKLRYTLHDGDFLFVRVNGSKHLVGKHAIFKDVGEDVGYNDHLIRISFDTSSCVPHYLSYYLNGDSCRHDIDQRVKTSAGQFTVSAFDIKQLRLPLPPIHEQVSAIKYLDSKVEPIAKALKLKNSQKEALIQQRQSLIYEYVTGKRRVTEAIS